MQDSFLTDIQQQCADLRTEMDRTQELRAIAENRAEQLVFENKHFFGEINLLQVTPFVYLNF